MMSRIAQDLNLDPVHVANIDISDVKPLIDVDITATNKITFTNITDSGLVRAIRLTQAAYNALTSPDPDTYYLIDPDA